MSDGIIKTSELPKIIPPLPTGDTKDLKVWQDYWKQHDEKIRQDERETVLNELKKDLKTRFIPSNNQWSKGRNSGLIECCNIIDESLRTEPEGT